MNETFEYYYTHPEEWGKDWRKHDEITGTYIPHFYVGQKIYTILGQRKYPRELTIVGMWIGKNPSVSYINVVEYDNEGHFSGYSSYNFDMLNKMFWIDEQKANEALTKKTIEGIKRKNGSPDLHSKSETE